MADLRYEAIQPSGISEPAVAALVSGFARAVLGEILWKLRPGAKVVSATTDGLLVDTEKLDLSGVICQRFQALVDRIAPGTAMTELKHVIGQAVAAKTRLQLTGLARARSPSSPRAASRSRSIRPTATRRRSAS